MNITDYRAAIDAASAPVRVPRVVFGGPAVVIVIAAVAVILLRPADADSSRTPVAIVVIVALLAVAALVLLPLRSAARRRRVLLDAAAVALGRTVNDAGAQLASIGYVVPPATVVDWVASPDSRATVPLTQGSVIAARWWRPAAGDDRVFLEPFLRKGAVDSALPALPPLQRG